MTKKNRITKIGFSTIGGIFVGKGIVSDFHKNYALTAIFSFDTSFTVKTKEQQYDELKAVLIQKNIDFRIESPNDATLAFIHIVPYSEEGIRLTDSSHPIQTLESEKSQHSLSLIKEWYKSDCNENKTVEAILTAIAQIKNEDVRSHEIDERILKALLLIMESEEEKLHVDYIAKKVHLSVSHFNRLFKKESGLTFRKFVLHSKLIKSISAIHENNNLTIASFMGGFSDQPHLSRTFKDNFGIKPSVTLK